MKYYKPFSCSPGEHRGRKVIFIQFENKPELISIIKQLVGSRWSQTNSKWYVPDVAEYRKLFGLT